MPNVTVGQKVSEGLAGIEIDETCDHWLRVWAWWQKYYASKPKLGYPDKSPLFLTGGATQRAADWFETETGKLEITRAEVMDTLIEDLEDEQRRVIKHVYTGTRESFLLERVFFLLKQAERNLLIAMKTKGIF